MSTTAQVELDAQYRQLREGCGWVDRSSRGMIAATGTEAAEFLQGQLTNDVEALPPGEGCYAALLDRKGHMQADMRVLRRDSETFLIDTEPQALAAVMRHLQTYKIGRDVEVDDRSGSQTMLSLIGPAVESVTGAPPPPLHASAPTSIEGVDCLSVGTGAGVDLFCDLDAGDRLRQALESGGAVEVGEEAAEVLRVEAGIPRFGAEMDASTMPAEAGIVETAVSFTKGCYIGQETVARLHYKGKPNRHLRGLRLDGHSVAGAPLFLDGKQVGSIGTVCLSPQFGRIGLAIVRREAEPGSELRAGEDGVTARVVDLPFR